MKAGLVINMNQKLQTLEAPGAGPGVQKETIIKHKYYTAVTSIIFCSPLCASWKITWIIGPGFSFDTNVGEEKSRVEIHVLEFFFLIAYTSPNSPWCFTYLTLRGFAFMVPSASKTLTQLLSVAKSHFSLWSPPALPKQGLPPAPLHLHLSLSFVKRQNRPKMESLMLSPTSPNWDLIIVSTLYGILNQSIRNHLISTSDIICWVDPCPPLKKSNFAILGPAFLAR